MILFNFSSTSHPILLDDIVSFLDIEYRFLPALSLIQRTRKSFTFFSLLHHFSALFFCLHREMLAVYKSSDVPHSLPKYLDSIGFGSIRCVIITRDAHIIYLYSPPQNAVRFPWQWTKFIILNNSGMKTKRK